MKTKTNEEMYLDWFNNFLTIERFAEYYSMSVGQAKSFLEKQRSIYNATPPELHNELKFEQPVGLNSAETELVIGLDSPRGGIQINISTGEKDQVVFISKEGEITSHEL
jgi:hypothetical protein